MGQEEPGGARRSREESGGARRSQEDSSLQVVEIRLAMFRSDRLFKHVAFGELDMSMCELRLFKL